MISTKGRYSLRCMVDIAMYSNGEYVSLKDTALRQNISIKYLEQVASILTKSGFLTSMRGNNGGYKLTKSPDMVTAGDILRAAEGALEPIPCLTCTPIGCPRKNECTTLNFWIKYNEVLKNYVDNVKLQDLIDDASKNIENNYSI